jgi:hypothetical protein
MCPRCGVYTWSSGLISQWIDHMTCEVSWAYIVFNHGSSSSILSFVSERIWSNPPSPKQIILLISTVLLEFCRLIMRCLRSWSLFNQTSTADVTWDSNGGSGNLFTFWGKGYIGIRASISLAAKGRQEASRWRNHLSCQEGREARSRYV